jgi:hypothetical protein
MQARVRVRGLTFSSGPLLPPQLPGRVSSMALAVLDFDALPRCYLKLLPLPHQVSCCHLALAFRASCTGAKLPHCFFQMIAGSSTVLPPAAGSWRLLDVGAGKLHARVRSSSHVRINAPCRIGDGCMYMSWLDAGFFRPLLRAVELLPGEIWCAPASVIVLC